MHVAANEYQGELIFLHKVKEGAVDDSYGIQVAKLADLPDEVIERAQVILDAFEAKDEPHPHIPAQEGSAMQVAESNQATSSTNEDEPEFFQGSFDLFENPPKESAVEAELKQLNLSNMTPLEALIKLNELQNQLK